MAVTRGDSDVSRSRAADVAEQSRARRVAAYWHEESNAMSDTKDDDAIEVPSRHPLRQIARDHPLGAVLTAFVIGLLLARIAF